jgi:uncharacterized protein YqiB (DUF1249 family)
VKSVYRVDLRALHARCEANYARLKRLFPDYESRNSRRFCVGGERVHIEVLERTRYTTLFCLHSWIRVESPDSDARRWLAPLRMELRAYHDVCMLEVISFQGDGRTVGRYAYPNPRMHQQDEKSQQNAFLAEWLEHCLCHGEAALEDAAE